MYQQPPFHRRRNCRSLCFDAFEAKHDFPGCKSRFDLEEFHLLAELKRPGIEAISSKLAQLLPANRQNHSEFPSWTRRRQCRTDDLSSCSPGTRRRAHHQLLLEADSSTSNKAPSPHPEEEGEPSLEAATSDAHAYAGRSTNLCCTNQPHHVPDKKHETKVLEDILTQAKHPASTEWEKLWYHNTVAAYQRIAHHFPDLRSTSSDSAVGQSISEPTLDISSLKKEDQAIFKREEGLPHEPFAPKSEQDRVQRQQRAAQASSEAQRLALLLGLPTFEEYAEQKREAREQSCQDSLQPSKRQLKRQAKFAGKTEKKRAVKVQQFVTKEHVDEGYISAEEPKHIRPLRSMTHETSQAVNKSSSPVGGAEHRPLVVGLTKPQSTRSASTMASTPEASALNKEISENVKENTTQAAPSEDNPTAPAQKPKKEKAPKQPKPQKAAAPTAPTSPALIDLRVGHILRAIAHPNADSLYVSTIAMGDDEGADHTQVDEETGKVVRTVCSGLNGLVPLDEMQNRKVIVVANLKPVNMRSIKSAAMVLAASPKQPEGADPHAADRVVELVSPPEGAEAGDKVYFEGWPYGEGKGPEKTLNPKKKQWEAIQPGFYTSDDLVVGFDASQCEEVDGSEKGNLVVEGKGVCKVKTLKGAVVR
ncbi:G4 quadruplex nucleic acid binding protein [Knufia fluminis]|uniref:G4 quadruplex nucleic acid binding protein n=1 Tax=Knufia fluminis TaxID=191047 RepID=A0AAN8IKM7_9EURO|nr:G4 quadruplex nucleic acid binding protein [Knufia fluminis]